MAKILSIMNFKGGVAKTATSINLCDALNMEKKNVLLVDLDTQCNATMNLNDGQKSITYEENGDQIVGKTIFETLTDESLDSELPIYTYKENFDFVPASIQLRNIDVLLSARIRKEDILNYYLQTVKEYYDYIILDCPPGDGIININAMSASDYIIGVTTGANESIEGLSGMFARLEQAKKLMNVKAKIISILFTKFDPRTNIHKDAYVEMKEGFPELVSNIIINENIKMQYASKAHKTIFEYARYCDPAIAYKEYAKEIIKKCI